MVDLINEIIDEAAIKKQVTTFNQSVDDMLAHLLKLSEVKISIDSGTSLKDQVKYVKELDTATQNLSATETRAAASGKAISDAYGKLNEQYQAALRNAKNVSVEFGANSEKAAEAARQAALYKGKLQEINNLINTGVSGTNIEMSGVDIAEVQAGTEALKEQTVEATASEKALSDAQKELNRYATAQKNASQSLVENNLSLKANRNEQKAINDQIKAQGGATDQQIAKLNELVQEETLLNRANQDLTTTIKNQAREFLSLDDSIEQTRSRLILLQQQYDNLSGSARNASEGIDLKNTIKATSEELKKLEGETGRFQRNVGNYSGAISTLKQSFNDVGQKIEQFTKEGKGNTEVVKALEKEYSLLDQLLNRQEAGFANATAEIRENQKALLQMEQAGLSGSKAFQELSIATASLKDDVADLTARTKVLGSDTFAIDSLIDGAQTLAGVYGVAQGAAALFGEENEELQKTFVKLQAAQTIIQGLQSISNGLQKESAFILGVQSLRTKALLAVETLRQFVLRGTVTATAQNTVATTANTAAQGANAVATRVATGALVGFRAALIATGIGAILVLLASAASAMGAFGGETKETTIDLEKFNEEIEFGNQLLESQIQGIERVGEIRVLTLKAAGATEKQIHDQEMANIAESKKVNDEKLASQRQIFNELLKDADRLTNAAKRAGESFKTVGQAEGLLAQSKIKKDAALSLVKDIDTLKAKSNDTDNALRKKQLEFEVSQNDKSREEAKKAAEKRKKDAEDAAKKLKELQDREAKAAFELTKLRMEDQRDYYKRIADNDKLSYNERLAALQNYFIISGQLIEGQKKNDLSQAKTSSEKELVIERAAIASA